MYANKTIGEFLRELSSGAPTPGGGSAAALSGATGAALVCMVCNLTIGREKYKAVESEMQTILAQASSLRDELLAAIDADVAAYGVVAAASKMPRGTDEEKAARTRALQAALKAATRPPLDTARLCAEVMGLCRPVGERGNVNAVSDAGVGIAEAEAGLRSAALNVKINLGLIKDPDFVAEAQRMLNGYLAGKAELREAVLRTVEAKL
ncbi:MAG: cyclodeaminase/cyclohydrolase family protein [Chloroflexi bacterium]|nr:cyclodeaminase/cyclohydrolase family protein [Chloroflexota bacterium]MCL5108332.1 cyclodeaminase/cyclohydrolase family protein [Chloroflexota bacterium]